MKTETIYLRLAFDFTDNHGNTIRENLSYNTALAIPLRVDTKRLGLYEGAIIQNAIGDMIVELIQSGQINHLCPQILGKASKKLDKTTTPVQEQFLSIVVFDSKIEDKSHTFQNGLNPSKMKLGKWGGPFAPDSKAE
jgi:hypothetical protein